MKKRCFILSAVFILIGAVLAFTALSLLHFDMVKLGNEQETVTYDIPVPEPFSMIAFDGANSGVDYDIVEGDTANLRFNGSKHITVNTYMDGSTLHILCTDDRQWYDHIGVSTITSTLTVTLPEELFKSYRKMISD